MAKQPNPGKCVHCLHYFEDLNWDHVFPKSWYPDTTPCDLYKWQIPSCKQCNDEYGRIEKDLMIRFGLCLDPADPSSQGIVNKALRSLDPSYSKNEKDERSRLAKREQIMSQFLSANEIPRSSIYPNFGFYSHVPIEDQAGITISKKSINKLNEKIVRGIMYIEDGIYIEPPYSIDSFTLTDEASKPIIDAVEKFGVIHAREPGIIVKRATIPEDKTTSLFAIEIWQRLKMYSSIFMENA
jgi:hypothetical protein